MALINRADLVEKLRKAFGVFQGSVGATLSDELIGVVIVDDVSGPDVVSTQHPLTAIGGSNVAAAAGFLGKVGLQNPATSGVDLFVDKVIVQASGARTLTIRLAAALPATVTAGIKSFMDQRVEGNPTGVTFDQNATVTFGTQILELRLLTGTTFVVPLGITLGPGDVILVQNQTANQLVDSVEFYWTERIRRE